MNTILTPGTLGVLPRYAISGALNNGEGGTLVDIDALEFVESLEGDAAGNL